MTIREIRPGPPNPTEVGGLVSGEADPHSITLDRLMTEELDDQRRLGLDQNALYTAASLMSWLKKSDLLLDVYREGVPHFIRPQTDEHAKNLIRNLAGRIFEDLAYSYLSQRQGNSTVLLSPALTSEFVVGLELKRNPEAHVHKYPFSHPTVSGIYVPDGIAVRNINGTPKITAVYEYKAGAERERWVDNSINGFDNLKGDFGFLFHHAQFVVVTPHNSSLSKIIKDYLTIDQLVTLPLDNTDLRSFVDGVYKFSPEGENPSFESLAEWVKIFKERRLIYDNSSQSEEDLHLIDSKRRGHTFL